MELIKPEMYESPKAEVFEFTRNISILENLSLQGDVVDMQEGGEIQFGDLSTPW